jgi:programmed cell death 6-interacting protein
VHSFRYARGYSLLSGTRQEHSPAQQPATALEMLGVGLKRGNHVDMDGPLLKYVEKHFTADQAGQLREAARHLSELRTTVIETVNATSLDYNNAVKEYERYFASFSTLVSHVPYGNYKKPGFFSIKNFVPPCVKMDFGWYGSFDVKQRKASTGLTVVVSPDPNYEKACVAFNTAALYSRRAVAIKVQNEGNSNVEASKAFQEAAGVFAHILTEKVFLTVSSLSKDFSHELLQGLKLLMLAQAQACVLDTAVAKGMAPALLCKLAMGASELYKQSYESMQDPVVRGMLRAAAYPWDRHIYFQYLCFRGSSLLWRSKTHRAADAYGKEIADLRLAMQNCKNAKQYQLNLFKTVCQHGDDLIAIIGERLKDAEFDNNTSYFYPVPESKDVEEIEVKVIVKETPYQPEVTQGFANAFANLLPTQVIASETALRAELRESVDRLKRKSQEDTYNATLRLSGLNLPAALDAMAPDAKLPDNVWQRVVGCQHRGSVAALEGLFSALDAVKQDTHALVESVSNALQTENKEDDEFRLKFGARWNRSPSREITAGFVGEMTEITKFLGIAAESDSKVALLYAEKKHTFQVLTKSKGELDAMLPVVAAPVTPAPENNPATQKVRALLDQLTAVLQTRDEAIEGIEKQAQSLDSKEELCEEHKRGTLDAYVKNKTDEFKGTEAQLTGGVSEQVAKLMQEISAANEIFLSSRQLSQASAERERVIQSINVAADTMVRVQSHLKEGVQFYNNMLRSKCHPLKQEVDSFIVARDMEKQLVLKQLTSQMSNYSSAPASQFMQPQSPQHANGQQQQQLVQNGVQQQMAQLSVQEMQQQQQPQSSAPPVTTLYDYQGNPIVDQQQQQQPQNQHQSYELPISNPNTQVPPNVYPTRNNDANPPHVPQRLSKSGTWACASCTFQNELNHLQCGMCQAEKPQP